MLLSLETVKMKWDTGAATNLLPHKMEVNNQPQLRKSKAKLTAYGDHNIVYESKVLYCIALLLAKHKHWSST